MAVSGMTFYFSWQQYDRHNPKIEEMLNEMWLMCTNCVADNQNPPLSPVLSIIALYNNIL